MSVEEVSVTGQVLEQGGADNFLERFFKLRTWGTTVGTEVMAGLTTFMVMGYIIFVNPTILTTTQQDASRAGQDHPRREGHGQG